LHSVGRSRVHFRRRRSRRALVAVIVAVFATPASAAMACPPAVDQYTEHLPGAGSCSGSASGAAPVARAGLLSDEILADLTGRDGRLLAQIATARDLGAPGPAQSGEETGSSDGGFATAVAGTLGTVPALILFGALGGIALAGGWNRFLRRGGASADLD
jgi:hypothetical protein